VRDAARGSVTCGASQLRHVTGPRRCDVARGARRFIPWSRTVPLRARGALGLARAVLSRRLMPTFEQARAIILEHARPLGPEKVPALDAVGRVLAEDVIAPWDFPLWDNSAMDGWAVRADDVAARGRLEVVGCVAAGEHRSEPVAAGTAVRILTGAPVPPGADAVVPLEDADERDGWVVPRDRVRHGAHVRRRGEDLRAGDVVLARGTAVRPAEVALLASFGRLEVPVFRRARVAILSTGDELLEPGAPLAPGKIYDANGLAVAAAVREVGGEPLLLGIARDDRASLRALLARGLEADALVTTAGVSMGDRDLVRDVLEELSVRQLFWKVDVKPGRPTAFGLNGAKPVFSLPGNPVSTIITFEQFVRPALLRMMGHPRPLRPLVPAVLVEDVDRKAGRVGFVRVRLERRAGALVARSAGNQDTGIVRTMLQADGIAIVPADRGSLRRGETIEVQVLRTGLAEEA
jgi:molybdopterin molybdotransferase